MPPGFKQRGDKIEEPEHSGVFSHHRWLEEFCLLRAHSLLRAESDVTAALGVKLRSPGTSEGNDEADVVLLRGGRVLVIEAKAREQPGGSGAQLQKRIAKTRTFFGDLAKVLFVHPGYNAPALRVNRSMVDGRYVRIVGSDLTELDSAICWGIG